MFQFHVLYCATWADLVKYHIVLSFRQGYSEDYQRQNRSAYGEYYADYPKHYDYRGMSYLLIQYQFDNDLSQKKFHVFVNYLLFSQFFV